VEEKGKSNGLKSPVKRKGKWQISMRDREVRGGLRNDGVTSKEKGKKIPPRAQGEGRDIKATWDLRQPLHPDVTN